MKNYKIIIQYDGTNYCGWQIQQNAPTIQQAIVDKLEIITKIKVNLTGAGRTDSGVHALGQVANFNLESEIDTYRFRYSLNSILPVDISITRMEKVYEKFNARFDAKKRSYIYLLSYIKSPFLLKYSYFYHEKLDCSLLNNISQSLLGENDFTSFARKNTETENKICNIYNIKWKETKGLIVFFIEADRFLHGMVRTIIGTLIKAAKTNQNSKFIKEVLSAKDRECAGEAVPAKGLFLFKVKY
ncbi:MAG: tRNA pseudouridine(38-40) synthase TruA [Ignavibacteriaceae bacterium]